MFNGPGVSIEHMKKCRYCSDTCIKAGMQRNGAQRYRCKSCRKYQLISYLRRSYIICDQQIKQHVKEGIGIRSISRLLALSPNTVMKRLRSIANRIAIPTVYKSRQVYEMDELHTYIGSKAKPCWIIYALERATGTVVDFCIGSRTINKLKQVVQSIVLRSPKRIYTDKFSSYETIMKGLPHRNSQYGTNRIERKNLNLRTHLKRLNRRTICFSKKRDMLEACLKIYFWG